ncbi:alpha/beta hydrolase family protein [Pedobacter caeni]|uniref:Predicted dienelactone hydrolase n=1 Tax=Pedobacter caeni TaxID=288992 RepID=A0A1M5JMC3_9SPHI|nr:hypothetical protein [Pedobacter caeni]SHG41671.1 Predicted dienelactone hydrolase [Pedobacter caeni]
MISKRIWLTIVIGCFIISFAHAQTRIGQRTFNFKDEQRKRPVVTELWYPTTDSLNSSDQTKTPFLREFTVRGGKLPADKFPLILISHGTGGGRLTLEWLAQGLAKSGFMVAAVDHWGNTFDNKIPIEFVKPWERPLDISFALSSLLNDSAVGKIIDRKRIGAAGFSYGGYTVIALAGGVIDYKVLINYYQTTGKAEIETPEMPGSGRFLTDTALLKQMAQVPILKDQRIKAFFSISPALGAGFTSPEQFKTVKSPVYFIGAHDDQLAPVKTNAFHYHKLIKGSGYFEFPGKAGHYVMLNEANEYVQKDAPLFFTDAPGVNRKEVHLKVSALAISFFQKSL